MAMKGSDDSNGRSWGVHSRRRVCSVRLSEATLAAIEERLGPRQSTAEYIRGVLARELGIDQHRA